MEDHKRKSKQTLASEEIKKSKVDTPIENLKAPLAETSVSPASFQIPNDGDALLLKLIHTRVMSIKTRDEIIFSAQRNDNLCKVFKGLSERKFLSVPVFTQTDKKKWLSFIDLSDIVRYVSTHFTKERMSPEKDFWLLSNEEDDFKKLRVDDVMSFPTKENKFHPITSDHSLFSVAEIMARDPHAHHIAILDNMTNRHLVSILTQSQMVKFVYDNLQLLGSKKDLLIKDMRGLKPDVLTLPSTSLAIDAFKLMDEKNVSGIGVVDEQGQLIDTLSIRDLKGMATDGSLFWKLYRPLSAFLNYLKSDLTTVRPRNALFCTKDETFESCLTKIYSNSVHRIFIVDGVDTRKPIGVISLGDLLLQILPF